MELEDLKEIWQEQDRKLQISIRLNRRILYDSYTGHARWALRRLALALGVGALGLLAMIVFLGAFIHNNLHVARMAATAALVDVFAIVALGAVFRQIALALRINYFEPVAVIQKSLEQLRQARIRYVQSVCIMAPLLWFPLFVVWMQAAFRVDVYRTFDVKWIVTNVAFGVAAIPVGYGLLRILGHRANARLLRDLAGYNLNAASAFLARLEEFEREA
jgi:serine/threonine-protein kinase